MKLNDNQVYVYATDDDGSITTITGTKAHTNSDNPPLTINGLQRVGCYAITGKIGGLVGTDGGGYAIPVVDAVTSGYLNPGKIKQLFSRLFDEAYKNPHTEYLVEELLFEMDSMAFCKLMEINIYALFHSTAEFVPKNIIGGKEPPKYQKEHFFAEDATVTFFQLRNTFRDRGGNTWHSMATNDGTLRLICYTPDTTIQFNKGEYPPIHFNTDTQELTIRVDIKLTAI